MNPRLKALMVRYLLCNPAEIEPHKSLKELGGHDWQIIEMAMEFETIFNVPMDADKALSLLKVSDWERLISG